MTEDALNEKIVALEKIMQKGFNDINRRLDEVCARVVGIDRFSAWVARVERNEHYLTNHDDRIDKLERTAWLLGILGALALSVITALLIAWATGKIQVVVP